MDGNSKENHLGNENLFLNRKSNRVIPKNLLISTCLILLRVIEISIMTKIYFMKIIVCLMMLLFDTHMLKRLLRIFVSVINKLTFGHQNINSLRKNFDHSSDLVKGLYRYSYGV